MALPQQVFIVGMNGSGTTMLLDHLSSHPMLYGYPSETKLLPYFLANQSTYGTLSYPQNLERLWFDMWAAVVGRARCVPAGGQLAIDPGMNANTAAGIFDQILRLFAIESGKAIWCEKTPMHVNHLALLGGAFPNSKFIHIIRDGRDCAASFHRRWKFNPLRTVYRWKKAVRAGQSQGASLEGRYFEVRYEDVTRDAEMTLRGVCSFIGVQFDHAVLEANRSRPDIASSMTKQIEPNRRNAVSYFDRTTLAHMERIAGKCLTELGYSCSDSGGDLDPALIRRRWWELTDDLHRFAALLERRGRNVNASNLRYMVRRVRTALRQKTTSKP